MINKFQQGGAAQQQKQDPRQVVMQIAQAAQQGDEQSAQIMQLLQELAPAYVELMQQQSQQPTMAKCGAKLHKKGEQGLKLVKKAECGCKAKLKRVGGKLVNVDCNGNIVK